MKILSAQQIRQADDYTIANEPVKSIDLMERAAIAVVEKIKETYPVDTCFKIVCGLGNNGGDGLAVARLLFLCDYKQIEVAVVRYSDKMSDDFKQNFTKLESMPIPINNILNKSDLVQFQVSKYNEIFIDALLGTGINRPVEGILEEVIDFINQQPAVVISIDIPSGLFCDQLNETGDCIVKADFTYTLQFPKLSFMFPETADCVGEFSILNIDIHPGFVADVETPNYFITKSDITKIYKKRPKTAHKGTMGNALLCVGSYGKMGAAVLAAKGCLKAGVGLLTLHIPECGYNILQTSVPEAMVMVDSNFKYLGENQNYSKYHSIGIGPGIGMGVETQNVVKALIQNSNVPVVFDADAINCIAENKTWLSFVPTGSIFTPHPKEFERLTEKCATSEERIQLQRNFSVKHNVYVVLKGPHTSISCPDGSMYFNSTGNPGMATGGSGDVLTGVITSLMAQGYSSLNACLLGVYLHGLAGDFAAVKYSEESVIASDIINNLSNAFKYIRQ